MAYETYTPVSLFKWVNNETRLNESNMNVLENAIQEASDALLDRNGNGLIPDVKYLNNTVYGDSLQGVIGNNDKIKMITGWVFQ